MIISYFSLSDAMAYMYKAVNGPSVLFLKMQHLTCLAHGLQRAPQEIRSYYPKTDQLISARKETFIKTPFRIAEVQEVNDSLRLSPQPITTLWGSWIGAVLYYPEYYDAVKEVVSLVGSKPCCFDQDSARSVTGQDTAIRLDLSRRAFPSASAIYTATREEWSTCTSFWVSETHWWLSTLLEASER